MAKPHPNRQPFTGILTMIDQPSDMCVGGAMGHRTLLTMEAAENGLESLEGMGIGFRAKLDGHDKRNKCGVITKAWIDGAAIYVSGHLYLHDFPELVPALNDPSAAYGMSYEIAEADIENMQTQVWRVTRCIFTGAALMLRAKAAYRNTRFNLSACGEDDAFTGTITMLTPEPLKIG